MALPYTICSRFFTTSVAMNTIKNVTIIGGGLMGSGIAQVAAQSGHNVTLVDLDLKLLQKAESNIAASLPRIAKKLYKDKPSEAEIFITETKNRLRTSTDLREAVKDADLALEAITENLEVKQKLFRTLDEAAPEKTIFATNTSSISVHKIGSATKRLDRFGGLHFFSPVQLMKLLEVVKTSDTSEATFKSLMEWGKALGKVCITCKDTPGFVVNRLLVPYLAEAIRLYERGDASIEDIDTAMKLGAGYPMGPFELADFIGHDVTYNILVGWYKDNPSNELFKPSNTLAKLIKEGKLGAKTGEGFYKHNK